MTIHWIENDVQCTARWLSNSSSAPLRVVIGDDRMTADVAFRLASEGTAILWRGDFQNARQLLQAVARRIDRPSRKSLKKESLSMSSIDRFNAHRQKQSQRARTLGALLIPFDENYGVSLRRAPDVRDACLDAFGPIVAAPWAIASLRELQGAVGAYEWRRKGIDIPVLGDRIHPHYGVFAPVRNEYLTLLSEASLSKATIDHAWDVGTGTGVVAAILLKRGVRRVTATDLDAKALACAAENLNRLGYGDRVDIVAADLFPSGRADLIVCNPPWLPARPSSALEHAIYDPENRMLTGFLHGLAEHLTINGEGWLILSDLAEHLGLRTREFLMALIEQGGLSVKERIDIRPSHPKMRDEQDPLYEARAAEITSLWRLASKG